MQPSEFWKSELWEVLSAIEGQREMMQERWEIARFSAFYAMLPHSKKGKLRKYTDIVRFSWDSEKHQKLSKSEVSKLFKEIKERDEKAKKVKNVTRIF